MAHTITAHPDGYRDHRHTKAMARAKPTTRNPDKTQLDRYFFYLRKFTPNLTYRL